MPELVSTNLVQKELSEIYPTAKTHESSRRRIHSSSITARQLVSSQQKYIMLWMLAAFGAGFAWSVKDTPPQPSPSIALRKPGLWALGASATAYVGLAAMQGLHDRHTNGAYSRNLMKKKEEYLLSRSSVLVSHRGLSLTVVGLNLAVFIQCQSHPSKLQRWVDLPGRTWTLLTCAFCHKDIQHLSANMFSLVPEIPQVLQVCGQSPYQFTAFYVSAAILSSYAQRVVSYIRWTQRWSSRFGLRTPVSMGASGVAMAVFAASYFAEPLWASPSFLLSALTLGWQVTNDLVGLFYSNEPIGFAVSLPWNVVFATAN